MTTAFTPFLSLAGGIMIGVASVLLMALFGRIAGVSGIAVRMFPPYLDKDSAGRIAFIAGLVAAPLLFTVAGAAPTVQIEASSPVLLAAGALAGFGSVWGNGCTSGHGVCGLARLSKRSLVAVVTFMATAIITVYVTRHVM